MATMEPIGEVVEEEEEEEVIEQVSYTVNEDITLFRQISASSTPGYIGQASPKMSRIITSKSNRSLATPCSDSTMTHMIFWT